MFAELNLASQAAGTRACRQRSQLRLSVEQMPNDPVLLARHGHGNLYQPLQLIQEFCVVLPLLPQVSPQPGGVRNEGAEPEGDHGTGRAQRLDQRGMSFQLPDAGCSTSCERSAGGRHRADGDP